MAFLYFLGIFEKIICMNHIYFSFFIIVLISIFFSSCDKCGSINLYRDQSGFNLEIRNANTREHLFFGNNAIYNQNEFEIFTEENDSLIVHEWNIFEDENCFSVYTNDTYSHDISFDKLTDTFYIQIPNSPMDTLMIKYNRETTECFEDLVTNYDIRQNGILICESCTLKHRVIIFKD